MPNIVMSYRRADSMAMAGRIRDRLAARFGENNVFMDLDSIPVGTDFRTHIQEALAASDVMLVIVGPNWRGTNAAGKARVMEAHDPVRIEVESAMRQKVLVIPVLLDGAEMPEPSQLPEAISGFSYLNAAHVDSGRDFGVHVDRLIRAIERVGTKGTPTSARPAGAAWRPGRLSLIGAAAALVALIALGGWWLILRPGDAPPVVTDPVVASPTDPTTKSDPKSAPDPEPPAPAPTEIIVPTRLATGAENPPMQGYTITQIGDWQLACPQAGNTNTSCMARQNFLKREQANGQLALSIIAAWGTDGMRVLLFSVPVNDVDIVKGLAYQLPGGAPAVAVLAEPNCLELACMVDIRLTGTTWVALDSATSFDVAYTNRQGAKVVASVSLRGFKDAFARLSTPARAD